MAGGGDDHPDGHIGAFYPAWAGGAPGYWYIGACLRIHMIVTGVTIGIPLGVCITKQLVAVSMILLWEAILLVLFEQEYAVVIMRFGLLVLASK